MKDPGYQLIYDNACVIAQTVDVINWGLIPQKSEVTVDSTSYIIGQNIIKTDAVWTIYLRVKT
jgi:hypothetical protein